MKAGAIRAGMIDLDGLRLLELSGVEGSRRDRQRVDFGSLGHGRRRGARRSRRSRRRRRSPARAGRRRSGWSRMCRASACPPGQAKAQNGGSTLRAPANPRSPARSGVISLAMIVARCALTIARAADHVRVGACNGRAAGSLHEPRPPSRIAARHRQPRLAVRAEQAQAEGRIVDVERHHLPRQQRRRQHQRRVEPRSQAASQPASASSRSCRHSRRRGTARTLAEQPRGRADADQGVVLAVLVGVDRVEAQVPEDRRAIQRRPGRLQLIGPAA